MLKTTLAQILNAMEKNGYIQIRNEFIQYDAGDDTKPIAGCALGQAALNLGVNPNDLHSALRHFTGITTAIYKMNDIDFFTLPVIAALIRARYSYYLDNPVTVNNDFSDI